MWLLPPSSSSSLWKFLPTITKCVMVIFAVCLSTPLISSSFLAPSIPLLHQVPTHQPDLSHLGSCPYADGRQEVHCQPIRTSFSGFCHRAREGQSCWQRRQGKKTDHLICHSYLSRRDQTSICAVDVRSERQAASGPSLMINAVCR